MKVVEFKNLAREEGQIFYIRKYTCDAVIQAATQSFEAKIFFSIETNPFGLKEITVKFEKDPNYPLIPIKKALKEYILQEDNEGRIPC